jgi:hypothetical protein
MDFAEKSGLTEITLGEAATSVIGAILHRIVGDLRIHAGIDDEAGADHQHRVAVGGRARRHGDAGVAARAWYIFGIDLLAPCLRQLLRDDPRDHIGRAAGGEWHDQANRARRIGVGRRFAGGQHHRGQQRENGAERADVRHGILP